MTCSQQTLASMVEGARAAVVQHYRGHGTKGYRCKECAHAQPMEPRAGESHPLRRCGAFGLTVHASGTCDRFRMRGE